MSVCKMHMRTLYTRTKNAAEPVNHESNRNKPKRRFGKFDGGGTGYVRGGIGGVCSDWNGCTVTTGCGG